MPPRPDVLVALGRLGGIFSSGAPTGQALADYAAALDDLAPAALSAGVDLLIRDHERYFPTPAEIRSAAAAAMADRVLALPPPEHRLFPPEREIVRCTADEAAAVLLKYGYTPRRWN